MSSSSSTVEHIVLLGFKKKTEPEKVNACITQMNSLKSLSSVLHLTAGEIHHITQPSNLSFTHMLHSRYSSKSDLVAYTNHPLHLSLVEETLLPISEEIMAVDWIDEGGGGGREGVEVMPGWGMKLALMKPKRRLEEEEKGRVLRAVGDGWGEEKKGVVLSGGENFSPARGKGFSLASMAVFNAGLEVGRGVEEDMVMVKDGVGELMENLILLHYLVPSV